MCEYFYKYLYCEPEDVNNFLLYLIKRDFEKNILDKEILFKLSILLRLKLEVPNGYRFNSICDYHLFLAVNYQRIDLIELLLPKVNNKFFILSDDVHSSLLSVAITNKDMEFVKRLLESAEGLSIDTPCAEYWKQILYSVVGTNDFKIVEYVIDNVIPGGVDSVATLVGSIKYNTSLNRGMYDNYEPFKEPDYIFGGSCMQIEVIKSSDLPGYQDSILVCQDISLFVNLRNKYKRKFVFGYEKDNVTYQQFKYKLRDLTSAHSQSIGTAPDGMGNPPVKLSR